MNQAGKHLKRQRDRRTEDEESDRYKRAPGGQRPIEDASESRILQERVRGVDK